MHQALTFRPIGPDDESFLYEVYASTRAEEMALVDWTEDQQKAFLRMQFNAQHQYYQDVYAGANFQVILLNEQPIGRLYLARWSHEIRIIDIALLSQFRNTGIGTALLKDLLAEAAQAGQVVTIHVEKFNQALRLYERLGFIKTLDKGVYFFLKWTPSSP
ncbi:MAG: GNAT family N-acetyltransferase [Anaerolineales bacterium]|nr:GNAT family N-acetyltransferase [Anaerolineales bacterium]